MQELIEYDVRFSAIKIGELRVTFLDRCFVRTVSVVLVQMKTSGTGRGTRTVTSAKRREIARFNFVRLLAEATGREDHPRGKELLGGTRVLVFFSSPSPTLSLWKGNATFLPRKKEMRSQFYDSLSDAIWAVYSYPAMHLPVICHSFEFHASLGLLQI